jgi:hypothetical protein
MFLLNKLVITDLLLLIIVFLIFIAPSERWKSGFEGAGLMILLFSIGAHWVHYRQTKKWY